jgi:hypothetical protein
VWSAAEEEGGGSVADADGAGAFGRPSGGAAKVASFAGGLGPAALEGTASGRVWEGWSGLGVFIVGGLVGGSILRAS